jgi:flagellar biosynthesis/type III secretory pathway protein FliH
MPSVQPFIPTVLSSSDGFDKDMSEGLHRGFAKGLSLGRTEARAELTTTLRAELDQMRLERDAALGRAAGTDSEFERQKAAVQDLTANLANAVSSLNEAAREWREREATALEKVQHDALGFALEVVESIGLTAAVDTRLQAALASCVGLVGFADTVRIRVNPECMHALSMLPAGWDPSLVTLIADEGIEPGDVLCESGETQLQAGLKATLSRVRSTLGLHQVES